MNHDLADEFTELCAQQAPELKVEILTKRSIDWNSVVDLLVFGSNMISVIQAICIVSELWLKQRANHKAPSAGITITYLAENGANVKIDYKSLTQPEIDRVLASNPPRQKNPVRVLLVM